MKKIMIILLLGIIQPLYASDLDSIVKAIKEREVKVVANYFDDEVSIVERVPIAAFSKKNGFDGFINQHGLLYGLFFDVNSIEGQWQPLFKEDYKSLEEAIRKGKLKIYEDSNEPQIIIKYGTETYNILFKVKNNKVVISAIFLKKPPWK